MQIVVAILGLWRLLRVAAAWEDALRPRLAGVRRCPGTAALFGVDGKRLLASTFLLAGLLAGPVGFVAAYYGNISFSMGAMLGLKALVAAVVGGIGSVPGAFLVGFVLGAIEAFWSAYFDRGARGPRGVLVADRGVRARGAGCSVSPDRSRKMCKEDYLTVTLADIEAARRIIGAQVLRTRCGRRRSCPNSPARSVGQIRKSPGHQLVQGARRRRELIPP